MKLLPIFFILVISCNENRETASPINVSPIDSLSMAADSVNDALKDMKLDMAQAIVYAKEIVSLRREKESIATPLTVERYAASDYVVDDRDKKIKELTEKILAYEREIARLKNKVASDSEFMSRVSKVVPEYKESEPLKPNEKSLIVTLDKRLRGDGELSESGVSVYLVGFKKEKEVKKLMAYDISCETNYINSLGAKQANYYGGVYFFNGVPPGKYLIKVCAYYGNYMVIKRETDGYQMVAMKMSPPIQ